MNFSFGFFSESAECQDECSAMAIVDSHDSINNKVAVEHLLSEIDHSNTYDYSVISIDDIVLKKSELCQNHELDETSDIITGVYEGGYKVWECSLDLVAFMLRQRTSLPTGKAMELGCGHGFPGIMALLFDYSHVLFSDLNGEVIMQATWPNIVLNANNAVGRVSCFSGDWSSLSQNLLERLVFNSFFPLKFIVLICCLFRNETFNLILSAETLYSIEICRKVRTVALILKQSIISYVN